MRDTPKSLPLHIATTIMEGRWAVVCAPISQGEEWSPVILVPAYNKDIAVAKLEVKKRKNAWLRYHLSSKPMRVVRYKPEILVDPPRYLDFYLYEDIKEFQDPETHAQGPAMLVSKD